MSKALTLTATSGALPAAAYLASLNTLTGRRGQTTALRLAAEAMGADDWRMVNWTTLDAANTRAIMAKIKGAPATRNKVLSALKGVARMAHEQHLIDGETASAILLIRGDKGSRLPAGRDIDGGEVSALMRVCADDPTPAGARDAAIVALMRATGIRRAEVCALKLADLDMTQGEARVIGKGNKQREIPIVNGAANAMRDWLAVRGVGGEFVFCAINKSGRILTAQGLTPQSVNKMLDKRIAEAGIESLTAHDFRRTLAGDLMDAGSDIATVARLLGHSSVTTTQRYDRRGKEAVRRAAGSVTVPYFGRKQS